MRSRGLTESWRADCCMISEGGLEERLRLTRGFIWHTLCELAVAGFRVLGSHARQIESQRDFGLHLLDGL